MLTTCFAEMVRDVTLSITESFTTSAVSLEHDRGRIAIDSAYHHCWSRPPINEATPSSTEVIQLCACRCGAVTSSKLPVDCTWTEYAGSVLNFEREKKITNDRDFPPGIPTVCDCYVAKLRATELTGDIASTVLQTAAFATVH